MSAEEQPDEIYLQWWAAEPTWCTDRIDGDTSLGEEDVVYVRADRYDALVKAARRIQWHKANCAVTVGFNNPCSCGYDEFRAALEEAKRS